jgi:hypothetical protein
MSHDTKSALRRGVDFVAIFSRILARVSTASRGKPPHISDHIAKDIGLSPSALERHRFTYPSFRNVPGRF